MLSTFITIMIISVVYNLLSKKFEKRFEEKYNTDAVRPLYGAVACVATLGMDILYHMEGTPKSWLILNIMGVVIIIFVGMTIAYIKRYGFINTLKLYIINVFLGALMFSILHTIGLIEKNLYNILTGKDS